MPSQIAGLAHPVILLRVLHGPRLVGLLTLFASSRTHLFPETLSQSHLTETGGALEEHRRHHLFVSKEHPFKNSHLQPRNMLCLQTLVFCEWPSIPGQPFCGSAHSLFWKFQKYSQTQQDWRPSPIALIPSTFPGNNSPKAWAEVSFSNTVQEIL